MAEQKTVAIRIAVENVQQAVSLLKSFGSEGEAAFEQVARKANQAGAGIERSVGDMGRSTDGFRDKLQQGSFQLQDFIVQVQGGTSAFTAFAQQGSQFFSMFGPIPGLIATVGGVLAGLAASTLEFNKEATAAPEGVRSLIDALADLETKANDVVGALDGASEAKRRFVGGVAQAASLEASSNIEIIAGDLAAGQQTRFYTEAYRALQAQSAGVNRATAPIATRQSSERTKALADAIAKAAKDGNVEGLQQILADNQIFGPDEVITNLIEQARSKQGNDAAVEASKRIAAGGIPPVQDFGAPIFDASPFKANLPDSADIQRQITASEQTKSPFEVALRQKSQAEERAAQEYLQQRKTLLDQVTRSAQRTETPDEAVARVNRELVTLKANLDKLRRPGQDNAAVDNAARQAEVNAKREIAEIRQREAEEQQRKEQAAQRERETVERARQAYERDFRDAETEALQAARGVEEDKRKAYLDAFKEAEDEATKVAEDEAAERTRIAQQQSDLMADILATPWRELAATTSGIFAGIFEEFLATGRVSGKELAEDISGSLRSITAGFASNILTAPLNQGMLQLNNVLDNALKPGGAGLMSGLGQFARERPGTAGLMAGSLGLTAGNAITAMRGGNMFGSTVGGVLGGGAGFLLGGPIGAGIGSMAGGVLGGLFGGEKNLGNDRARLDYWTSVGTSWQDSNASPENRQAVNAFASEVDSLVEALAGLGATVGNLNLRFEAGNKTGLVFNGQQYGSQDDLMRGVIQYVGGQAQGLSASQQTVVKNTRAGSVQEFASDLAFAEQVDRTSRNLGPFATQLADLEDSFTGMKVRAEQLGLATDGLNAAYQRQRREIREQAQSQIDAFVSGGGIRGQIQGIRDQAEELTKMGRELGLATGGIAGAMRRQIGEIRDAVKDQVDAFRLQGRSGITQALGALKDQFEEVSKAAREAGVSTAGLTQAYNQQRAEIVKQARESIEAYTRNESPIRQAMRENDDRWTEAMATARSIGAPTRSIDQAWTRENNEIREGVFDQLRAFSRGGLVGAFDDLRARFLELRDAAKSVGAATEELNGAYQRQRREMEENAKAAVRDAERGLVEQTRGLQGVFEGLIAPIKEALGPFGIGNGITAPKAQIEGGVELFRSTLEQARAGDVQAMQSLVGIGQQTIGAAREYGASGKDFQQVFGEVNRGLIEMQTRLQDQQQAAMRDLQAVGRETLNEIVALRREGIAGVRDDLENLRFELRQLQDRMRAA